MTMPIEDPNLLRSILGKTQMVSQIAFFQSMEIRDRKFEITRRMRFDGP